MNTHKKVCITLRNNTDIMSNYFLINLDGEVISRVEETKYSGIIIDKRGRWYGRLISIVNKTKHKIYVTAELIKFLS